MTDADARETLERKRAGFVDSLPHLEKRTTTQTKLFSIANDCAYRAMTQTEVDGAIDLERIDNATTVRHDMVTRHDQNK
jgi:hypothetical protein